MNYPRYTMNNDETSNTLIRHDITNEIDYVVQYHCHDFYEIFLIVSGEMLHSVNGHTKRIGRDTLLFIRPDDIHKYSQGTSDPCVFVRLWVKPEVFDLLTLYMGDSKAIDVLLNDANPFVLSITKAETQHLYKRFYNMLSILETDSVQLMQNLKLLLFELLLHITNFINQENTTYAYSWLKELCNEMSEIDNFTVGIKRLFELSPTTREHLCRTFKKHLGITPTDYIKNLRLNYAANQLIHTNKKIIDICYDSGFGNLSYFYECFQTTYGVTPKTYRLSNSQKNFT